ncbi:MAG: DUF4381 family protein [Rikenellaceae bacterium]|jgi:hypothetical protein|nr:DUF4381 family protein [Rikenellaceae bacterium]
MNKRLTYILLALLFGSAFGGAAQSGGSVDVPTVRARVSADSLWIGDQFTLEVEVDKDLTQVIDFPVFIREEGKPGLIGDKVEVLAELPVDTLERQDRRVTIRKRYVLTAFDAGMYNLGLFPALFLDKNIVDTLHSPDSLRFLVQTFPIDTATMTIHDIKPPLPAPVLPQEWLGWTMLLFWGGQLLFVALWLLHRWNKRRKPTAKRSKRPTEPAHVTAIRELEKLQSEKLWQNQRHKLYYTRLTDIVREYIEGRYGVGAREMTSDEIIQALNELHIPARSHQQIQRLLSTADYVKFAKYVPDVQDNEMSWNDAYYFVEETKWIAADPLAEPEDRKEGGV